VSRKNLVEEKGDDGCGRNIQAVVKRRRGGQTKADKKGTDRQKTGSEEAMWVYLSGFGGLSHDKGEPSKKQCWLTEPFEASNVFAGRQLRGASLLYLLASSLVLSFQFLFPAVLGGYDRS
jgi:hypothetical protein